MKFKIAISPMALVAAVALGPCGRAEETHAESIVSTIMDTRKAILAKDGDPSSDKFLFMAFFDFDGTILKGDCSLGMEIDGRRVYKGLAQLTIESGYSSIYPPVGGWEKFSNAYQHLERERGPQIAYPHIPQMLSGARLAAINRLAGNYFEKVLSKYYFRSSVRMLKSLEKNGIECHIISASADVFVDAAAPTLGLDVQRFHGIEIKIRNGRLTKEIVPPVTWSDGKKEKLISIVRAKNRQHPGKQVVVLAAFGNSYATDGPFMKYVATRKLRAGHTVAVMINGGDVPEAYRNLFIGVSQDLCGYSAEH